MSRRIKLTDNKVKQARHPSPTPTKSLHRVWDSESPGLHLAVYWSGAKAWYFRYRGLSGRYRDYKLADGATPIEAARQAAGTAKAELANGVDPQSAAKARQATHLRNERVPTLDVWLTLAPKGVDPTYADHAHAQNREPEKKLRAIRQSFAHLLKRRLNDIEQLDLERWHQEKLADKSPAAANRPIQYLRHCLNYAIDRDLISTN